MHARKECRLETGRIGSGWRFRRTTLAVVLGAVVAGTGILGAAPTAQAQARAPVPAESARQYAIPAGSLQKALDELSTQSGIDIVYPPEAVEGRDVPAISVRGTWRTVLIQLLGGSGLSWNAINENTVVIRRDVAAPGRRPARTQPGASASPDPVDLRAIEVTGSRLGRAEMEGPQRVNVFTRQDIERSGQTTVNRFLATLPEVFNSRTGDTGFMGNAHAPTVQLRGFPVGSTLVLINGRRPTKTSSTYGSHFNLNNLPSSAVERIEVLPEGASAVYGSDALAGVVNIILKRDFDGYQFDAMYGTANGTNEKTLSFALGKRWERSDFTLVASYQAQSELLVSERKLTSLGDYTAFGGPDRRVSTCNPGNVYSIDGGNLPGLSAAYAAVPGGISNPTAADFAATAGRLNRCARTNNTLVPDVERYGALLNFNSRIGGALELFASLIYNRDRNTTLVVPKALSKIAVPAGNPFNPFGETVLVDFAFVPRHPTASYFDGNKYVQPLIGLRGALGASWDWEVAAWAGYEDGLRTAPTLDNTALAREVLSRTDPSRTFNVFGGDPMLSPALQSELFSTNYYGFTSKNRAASAVVRGPVFDLPAGTVSIAAGAEVSKEGIAATDPSAPSSYSRRLTAGYLEARVPLLGGARELLTLTGAVRRDEYSDFGGATTSQFGLEWRPSRSLLFRASFAESFVAPQLYFYNFPPYPFVSTIFDPVRKETATAEFIFGGNTSLRAQQGESWSLGMVWSHQGELDLQGSLSAWQLSLSERLNPYPSTSFLVANEALFPDRVLREPTTDGSPGRITTIDYRAMNLGELDVRGIDADLGYARDFHGGEFSAGVRATWIGKYEVVLLPGQAPLSYLGTANNDVWAPRLRMSVNAGWDGQDFATHLGGRYVSSFRDRLPLSDGRIQTLGDFWTWDASFVLKLGAVMGSGRSMLRDSRITLGAINLLDQRVPFSMTNEVGFIPSVYDIRGRFLYLSVGTRW